MKEIGGYMGEAFVAKLLREGKVPRTIKTVVASLRKLQAGIKVRLGVDVEVLPPDFKAPDASLDQRVRAHRYSAEEARQILEELDGEVALVVALQIHLGLRISEVLCLRPSDFDLERCVVNVKGKGGRTRLVPIDRPGAKEFVEQLISGAEEGKKFFWVSARTVQAKVRAACLKRGITPGGTHGFRRLYATLALGDFLLRGLDAKSSKIRVSRRLGHNRASVISHYVPRPR